MKKKHLIGFFVLAALVATVSIFDETVSANKDAGDGNSALAPILVENFDYPAGALLTDNGWTAHSGAGTNAITVTSPGLTLTGYPGSGVGNAASMTTSGEDVNRSFAPQSTGSVYASFLVNISEAAVDPIGGYFFHLGPDPVGTTFRGRVFAKKDASNNIAFGLSKAATADPNVAFTGFTYSLNTTYLIVVKYTVVDGATNDTVQMFISTTTPASEPAPTLTAIDVTATDIVPGTVGLRQGTAATHPTVRVDGIRVGTAWSDIVTAAPAQNIIDFNGDGRTDYAISRNVGSGPSGQRRWFYRLNGTTTTAAADWGIASDTMVPADYDGDNKTDIAVWRAVSSGQPANNAFFYILQSSNNTIRIESFGQIGDEPRVVGDYDGDGKDDLAVVRTSGSGTAPMTWFYRGSLNNPGGNITYVNWGISSDSLSIGDYDGDGKNDFVIVRDNGQGSNTFWLRQSTAGVSVRTFGPSIFPNGAALPYDFDGDGKTDIGVVDPTTQPAQWYYQPSSGGNFVQVGFGTEATDIPAVGDYDGDGRADIAIWRADGNFWIRNSGNNSISIVPWGSSSDQAVAGFLFY